MKPLSLTVLLAAAVFFILTISGCNPTDEINDAAGQTEEFDEDLEDMPIEGVPGECGPLVTFDQLLSKLSWWSDAKDHLDDVTIEELDYKVKDNSSTMDVTVDLYLAYEQVTDVSTLSEDQKIASTGLIEAGTNIEDWTPMTMVPGSEKRLEKLMMEPDTLFSICAKIPEVESGDVDPTAVNMKLGLRISGTATFVPL